MRVERVTDLAEVLRCLPFEREVRKKGRERNRESDMLMAIKMQIESPYFGFWMAYDDENNILGYAVGVLNLMVRGLESLYVLRLYGKQKEVRDRLVETLSNWAKEYRAKTAKITVTRNIKAMQRIFKFRPVSVNMERRI